jgi:hypothetical protein
MHMRPSILGIAIPIIVALAAAGCGDATSSPTMAPPASDAVVAEASPTAAQPTSSPRVAQATPTATASPSARPSPSPTVAAPTPAPTPTPWKTHKSKRFRYSVRYPADWVVTPGSAKRADQLDDSSTHFVFITRDTVRGVASVSLTVDHDIATFKSHYKAKLLSNKRVTLRGWKGRLLTFNGRDDGRKIYIQHLVIAKGRVGYIIEMFSDRGSAKPDKALFKKIYKTFKPRS